MAATDLTLIAPVNSCVNSVKDCTLHTWLLVCCLRCFLVRVQITTEQWQPPPQAAAGSVRTGNQSVSQTSSPPTPPTHHLHTDCWLSSSLNNSILFIPSQSSVLPHCPALLLSALVSSTTACPAQFPPRLKGQPAKLSARPRSHCYSNITDHTRHSQARLRSLSQFWSNRGYSAPQLNLKIWRGEHNIIKSDSINNLEKWKFYFYWNFLTETWSQWSKTKKLQSSCVIENVVESLDKAVV